ncbi:MAG: dUTP diphosphatase [Proteobacteria bacterium]|nr:dUTP diphosphatase [Pseudomonadota bacterium]
MNRVQIKVKRLREQGDIALPAYETDGSSGLDLRAAVREEVTLEPGDIRLIPTGLAVSVPRGWEAQIRPRSGLALKHGVGLVNAPGTIDSDYRGELCLILINWGRTPFTIKTGDRIAQMVITSVARAEMVEVDELDSTERGGGGFGHSGVG